MSSAATSSYTFLLTSSAKKEIIVVLSVRKMRRDPRLSSSAALTDGWSRFPTSKCMGNDSPSRILRTLHGRSKGRLAAADLESANGGGIAYASVIRGRGQRWLLILNATICACICVNRSLNTLIAAANGSFVPTFCAGGSIIVVIQAVRL